uniref:Uncharacterized protein n=1 Tax=Kalanchoe fedtschenkoi TaxID=63787 RepID=A0A7N0UNP7_KALFE
MHYQNKDYVKSLLVDLPPDTRLPDQLLYGDVNYYDSTITITHSHDDSPCVVCDIHDSSEKYLEQFDVRMSSQRGSNLQVTKWHGAEENQPPCTVSGSMLAGVVVFSAVPFTLVKAIANSPLGETLQRRMEQNKKVALKNSAKFKALAEKARKMR